MESTIKNDLPSIIKGLMEDKSNRDGRKFTASKLANNIGIQRSVVHRILKGESGNPRIETISKIFNFFSNDGFDVDLNHFTNTNQKCSEPQKIQLFLSNQPSHSIGFTETKLDKINNEIKAFVLNKKIDFFDVGSIFFVDIKTTPVDENIVAVEHQDTVYFCKYHYKDEKVSLISIDQNDSEILFCGNNEKIIGVVIKVEAEL